MCRFGWFVLVASVVGCWSSPDTIDGFTPEQWAVLQKQLAYAPPRPFDPSPRVALAAELFQDPMLSVNDTVSCQSCHDPAHGFIDSRTPDNVSAAAQGFTKRNAMTLYNVCYKKRLGYGADVFSWSGGYTSPGQVLELAIKKPFANTFAQVAGLMSTIDKYRILYGEAFGPPSGDATNVIHNLDAAFDDYFCTLPFQSPVSQFDLWLAGEDATLSDSAKRGFAVFVGRGTCIECHNGPLFSDFQFHNTGVPQVGVNVTPTDLGRASATTDDADDGKFVTGTLREIANTGPYMHDGAFATLADVIDFYRHGGVAGPYSGTRDPRIVPLDLTDEDAQDLEAFLRAISCDDPACGSRMVPPAPQPPDANAGPPDVGAPPDASVPDAFSCPPGTTLCGPMMCVDTQVDPLNCGACGNVCTAPKQNCVMGTCAH